MKTIKVKVTSVNVVVTGGDMRGFEDLITRGFIHRSFTICNFRVDTPIVGKRLGMTTFVIFYVNTTILLTMVTVVFHGLRLVFGGSRGSAPFRGSGIHVVERVNVFTVTVPMVNFVVDIVAHLMYKISFTRVYISVNNVSVNVVILYFSRFFTRNMGLRGSMSKLLWKNRCKWGRSPFERGSN